MLQSVGFTVGVGKTHVAQGLGHAAIRRGIEVRFTKTSRVLADLAGGHADRTWDKRLREYTRPGLLILDDFAMRELTGTQADDLYDYADHAVMPTAPRLSGHRPWSAPAAPGPWSA